MAYDVNKLTKLAALKTLAEKVKSDYATKTELNTLSGRVDDIVSTGGEPNVITSIKVNGAVQEIADKAVDITVPTKTSDLTNDSNFQSDTQVATAIAQAIAASGHASFVKVNEVPDAESAEENKLYLVMNSTTEHYDIYAKVGTEVVLLDDTTVDLSGYTTTEGMNALLADKVDKETGKGLSTNDYTTTEKEKLAGIEAGANAYVHPTYTQKVSGLYKVTVDATGHVSDATAVTKTDITGLGIPGQDTTYSAASAGADGLMSAADKSKLDGIAIASDDEVSEMLAEVFTTVA